MLNQTYIDRILAIWPKRIYFILKVRGFHMEYRLCCFFSFYITENTTSKNR